MKTNYIFLALFFVVFNSTNIFAASEQVEVLKLEIEKLKLQNENLKLDNERLKLPQGTQSNKILPSLNECLQNKNVTKCWEYYDDENEAQTSSYKSNVQLVKKIARQGCKTNREEFCSLLAKIIYSVDKDPAAIPIMEDFCTSLPKEMSMRCQDLVRYFVGIGDIEPAAIDVLKAEKYAKMCIVKNSLGNCYYNAIPFLYSTGVSVAEARRIAHPLLRAALTSKDLNNETKKKIEFYLGCKIELIVEQPSIGSPSHIDAWVRYKNLSTFQLRFLGELKAIQSNDSTKSFFYENVGHTLSNSRNLNPGEVIREEASFRVDEDKAVAFKPFFRIKEFRPTELISEEHPFELGEKPNPEKFCDFELKVE